VRAVLNSQSDFGIVLFVKEHYHSGDKITFFFLGFSFVVWNAVPAPRPVLDIFHHELVVVSIFFFVVGTLG